MTPLWRTIQAFWSLKRSTTWPSSKFCGRPTLNFEGGSDSTLGTRKRTVPSVRAAIEAEKLVQARAVELVRKASTALRRVGPAGLAAGAAGFGAAGAGGRAAVSGTVADAGVSAF